MEYRYSFAIAKQGDLIYISHLDLLRILQRACRRAGLAVVLTRGFSPRFKLKLHRALKLGSPSNHETGELSLARPWPTDEILESWRRQMPDGIDLKDIKFLE